MLPNQMLQRMQPLMISSFGRSIYVHICTCTYIYVYIVANETFHGNTPEAIFWKKCCNGRIWYSKKKNPKSVATEDLDTAKKKIQDYWVSWKKGKTSRTVYCGNSTISRSCHGLVSMSWLPQMRCLFSKWFLDHIFCERALEYVIWGSLNCKASCGKEANENRSFEKEM